MTRAAALALLALATGPALAGDSVPGAMAALVPDEWAVSLVMGELPPCTVTGDCCGVHRECGDGYQRAADPVPVPLPPTILLLTAAIAALIWKGKRT